MQDMRRIRERMVLASDQGNGGYRGANTTNDGAVLGPAARGSPCELQELESGDVRVADAGLVQAHRRQLVPVRPRGAGTARRSRRLHRLEERWSGQNLSRAVCRARLIAR